MRWGQFRLRLDEHRRSLVLRYIVPRPVQHHLCTARLAVERRREAAAPRAAIESLGALRFARPELRRAA